jgi:hypothetical protein
MILAIGGIAHPSTILSILHEGTIRRCAFPGHDDPFCRGYAQPQASTKLTVPRKSILPMSTPALRRIAYTIAMWK